MNINIIEILEAMAYCRLPDDTYLTSSCPEVSPDLLIYNGRLYYIWPEIHERAEVKIDDITEMIWSNVTYTSSK